MCGRARAPQALPPPSGLSHDHHTEQHPYRRCCVTGADEGGAGLELPARRACGDSHRRADAATTQLTMHGGPAMTINLR
jgi:hypothetical protein